MKKLFDKTLTITTEENKKYTIERKNIFIHGYSSEYSIADIMKKDNNIYLINEIYSYEDNRIRFSYIKYKNAKSFDTIEKTATGEEVPVMVIERYDTEKNFIGSIGNIVELVTDLPRKEHNKLKDKQKILKLLRKNKDDLTKVA
ncbi:MAG: hypothetical protein J6J17_01670 [Bacilli bacterium]|nr:hypothetical protein [Bacilli bacterium]